MDSTYKRTQQKPKLKAHARSTSPDVAMMKTMATGLKPVSNFETTSGTKVVIEMSLSIISKNKSNI